jgi:hypothetical protein
MSASALAVAEDDASIAALIAARNHLTYDAFDGLLMEGVPLGHIADVLGTPAWVYSAGAIRRRLAVLTAAMADLARVHYAVKANDHLAVLRLMAAGGAGADVVSEGELRRARHAGIAAADIVFSGVGKTAREIRLALEEGIGQLNVESAEELEVISALAVAAGRTAPVALRVNPDIDAGTLAKITTGTAENKFGIPWAEVAQVYARAAALPGVQPVGLAMHLGSQILTTQPYRAAFARMVELVHALRARGLPVARMDCGGGLPVSYRNEPGPLAGRPGRRAAGRGRAGEVRPLRGAGRGHERPRAAGHVRRLARHRAARRRERHRGAGAARRGRPGLRDVRHLRASAAAAASPPRGARGIAGCRRVRGGHEFDLQRPAARPHRHGRRRPLGRHPGPPVRRRSLVRGTRSGFHRLRIPPSRGTGRAS